MTGGALQFGVFDQNDHGRYPLTEQYDKRLALIEAYDRAGFRTYHMSEHHSTPLNLTPSPSVFLAAVAQRTRRIRFGALVYVLPAHHPLRLAEEICMLDHLSHGRLDVGVGRGVSPYEVEFHNVAHEETRDIFMDAFDCLSAGLTSEMLTYKSGRYSYKDVPIALRPLQQPHPPFWYASSSEVGSTWAGGHGLHYVTLGATAMAKANIEAFKAALAKRGAPAQPKAEFPGGVVIGVQRHIFVADTDDAAHRIFKPAMEEHLVNLNWLRVKANDTGLTSRLKIPHGTSYEQMVEHGGVIAGSPQTVRTELERQVRELGINYLLTYLFLGTMTLADALSSLALFKSEIMPHLSKL